MSPATPSGKDRDFTIDRSMCKSFYPFKDKCNTFLTMTSCDFELSQVCMLLCVIIVQCVHCVVVVDTLIYSQVNQT